MTRRKRKLWTVVALVAVVLLGAGGWLYYTVFMASDFALRHAETFLFRRMTVAKLAEQGTYRFFYVTNRRQENDEGPIQDRFGREREDTLKFGSFATKIEPSLGLGMLINPTEWFQNEEISLVGIDESDEAAFVEQVSKLVENSPYRSLLVVVHGYKEAFPSALRKTAFFGHVLDINSPVLLFDWPGNQGASLPGYRRARRVAKASGADLARALELIIRRIQPDRLWLVANSMGGQVVVDAFSLLYAEADLADAETEIDNVVLTAPDVDHDQFNEQFKKEISALAKNLTVYVSSNDRALVMSRIVNRARRRGESTLTPDQLEEAVRVAELIDPDSELVTLVDVSPVNRTRNFHNFSLETPEFFDDLFLRLTNEITPRSRRRYQIRTSDGSVYLPHGFGWLFPAFCRRGFLLSAAVVARLPSSPGTPKILRRSLRSRGRMRSEPLKTTSGWKTTCSRNSTRKSTPASKPDPNIRLPGIVLEALRIRVAAALTGTVVSSCLSRRRLAASCSFTALPMRPIPCAAWALPSTNWVTGSSACAFPDMARRLPD